MEDQLLTVDEVAARLRMTRKAVYDLMRAGRLPYLQIGIQLGRRIRQSALEHFLQSADKGVADSGPMQYNREDIRTPSLAAA